MDTSILLTIVSSGSIIAGAGLGAIIANHFSKRRQRQMLLSDFDRFEAEKLISLLEDILLDVQTRRKINEEKLYRLDSRALLLKYLTAPYQNKIQQLKELCFAHRDALGKSELSTTGVSQEEEYYRKQITELMPELVNGIRQRFATSE